MYRTGETLLRNIYDTLKVNDAVRNDNHLAALNTLCWPRKEVLKTIDGRDVIAHGSGFAISINESYCASAERAVTIQEVSEGIFKLQNNHFTVIVEKGCITSLYDRRANREVLLGKANQFVIFDDKPIYWQAWDVEVFHLETREELDNSTTSILEDTPLRVSVVTETKISDVSSIKTTISLSAAFDDEESQSYLECTAVVDWHETMKFLKVEFPVDVRHHEASYDTQFGIIRRPTHYNTS